MLLALVARRSAMTAGRARTSSTITAPFVANRRGKGWLWGGGTRLDQTCVARHVEVRLCGASTCWLSASLTRWPLQLGADGLGLTAQGAKRAEE
jgi:hypothetical protein